MSSELVAFLLEIPPDLWVVVNLSVKNDPDRAVLVRNRLMAREEIDHLEPSHAQSDITLDEETFVIGSAMNQSPTHPLDVVYRCGAISVVIDNAGDATHRFVGNRFRRRLRLRLREREKLNVLSSRLGGSEKQVEARV
jgi:hypothetical protein